MFGENKSCVVTKTTERIWKCMWSLFYKEISVSVIDIYLVLFSVLPKIIVWKGPKINHIPITKESKHKNK